MHTRTYRAFFGVHSFVPLMTLVRSALPGHIYGWLAYRVFNYLFSWTDLRWERRLRGRFFQFSPVYVSAECMRWWLGRGSLLEACVDENVLPDTSVYCRRQRRHGIIHRPCRRFRCM